MNLLTLLILGFAYLIGTVFVNRVLGMTKNDRDLYDVPRKNDKLEKTPRGSKGKIMIGRLSRTHSS